MEKTVERLEGDLPGVSYEFPVYRLGPAQAGAPSAYLQGAIHADELPGVVALHFLLPRLARAEAEGRLRGRVTVVPLANPVGRSQFLFGSQQGRFHLGSRGNFNRDFPLIERPDPALLPDEAAAPLDRRLKARLLGLALGHEIVLDLHCDSEGVVYLYAPAPLWPGMADLAACVGARAALVWDDLGGGAAFEQAALEPLLSLPDAERRKRVVSTVELRGRSDVDGAIGESDAGGLYRFLVGRGVIEDPAVEPPAPFEGPAGPMEHVEMLRVPRGGIVLYRARPGERVAKGQVVATLLVDPGDPQGEIDLTAPQEGLVVTRRAARTIRAGEPIMKILCSRPSATARPGALEA